MCKEPVSWWNIITAISAGSIALIGLWIAFQQWVIAQRKLNHDLFDRRFAVFRTILDYVDTALRHSPPPPQYPSTSYSETKPDIKQVVKLYHAAMAPTPFLFDERIIKFCQKVEERCYEAVAASGRLGSHFDPDLLARHQEWLWKEADPKTVTELFQSSLNLSKLEPYTPTIILQRLRRLWHF